MDTEEKTGTSKALFSKERMILVAASFALFFFMIAILVFVS